MYIGHVDVDKIDHGNIPSGYKTMAKFLDDGGIRIPSSTFGTFDPINMSSVRTLAKGQRFTRTRHFVDNGTPYNRFDSSSYGSDFTLLPYDSLDKTIRQNINSYTSEPMADTNQQYSPTFLWMPYIRDIAEGANPIQLRCSVTLETSITFRMWFYKDMQDEAQTLSNLSGS